MEVVYFFYESSIIRIPFFGYDQRLFRMLVSVGGGTCRYIQDLLGHSSLRTTERYTHIAKGSILNIISPLDAIS